MKIYMQLKNRNTWISIFRPVISRNCHIVIRSKNWEILIWITTRNIIIILVIYRMFLSSFNNWQYLLKWLFLSCRLQIEFLLVNLTTSNTHISEYYTSTPNKQPIRCQTTALTPPPSCTHSSPVVGCILSSLLTLAVGWTNLSSYPPPPPPPPHLTTFAHQKNNFCFLSPFLYLIHPCISVLSLSISPYLPPSIIFCILCPTIAVLVHGWIFGLVDYYL